MCVDISVSLNFIAFKKKLCCLLLHVSLLLIVSFINFKYSLWFLFFLLFILLDSPPSSLFLCFFFTIASILIFINFLSILFFPSNFYTCVKFCLRCIFHLTALMKTCSLKIMFNIVLFSLNYAKLELFYVSHVSHAFPTFFPAFC